MINLALIAVTLSGFRDKIKSKNQIERRERMGGSEATMPLHKLSHTHLFLAD